MQNRRLKPDENLIFHLIKSQSSTLETALRELVQNAHDAGATECRLVLSQHSFSITDNGRGFADAEEIEQFFETFGTPHPEEYENKFGRFRMGRCQIMAFAATDWQSNAFEMRVDIRHKGLNYELHELPAPQEGCHIRGSWYEPLTTYALSNLEDQIRRVFKYFYMLPLLLNGERISKSLEELAITDESPDCYLIYREQFSLNDIYNLGVYVTHESPDLLRSHFKGIILAKRHLTLDISRTKLQPKCPVWKRIEMFIRQQYPCLAGNQNLNRGEIRSYFRAIARRNITVAEIRNLRLFTDPQRTRRYSLADLARKPYTVAIPGYKELLADQLSQQGSTLVLSGRDLLEVCTASNVEDALKWFLGCLNALEIDDELVLEADMELVEAVFHHYVPFDFVRVPGGTEERVMEAALTPAELCAFKAIRTTQVKLLRLAAGLVKGVAKVHQRELWVGKSVQALGWTDGSTYIALEQSLLTKLGKGMLQAGHVAAVLVHEWCHRAEDSAQHDAEFYRLYHDLTVHPTLNLLPAMAYYFNMHYEQNLRRAGIRVPHAVEKFRFNGRIISKIKHEAGDGLRQQRSQTRNAEQALWEAYQLFKDALPQEPLPALLQATFDCLAQYEAARQDVVPLVFYGAGKESGDYQYDLPYLSNQKATRQLPFPSTEQWDAAWGGEKMESEPDLEN